MLKIGIPMALNMSLISISLMLLQVAVNMFGSSAVAAFTATSKVEQLGHLTLNTLGATMATFCGQNLGAKNTKRIIEGMKIAFFLEMGLAIVAGLINGVAGKYIIRLFLEKPSAEVMKYALDYMTTIAWFFAFVRRIFLYRSALQSLEQPIVPLISGFSELVFRMLVIVITYKSLGFMSVCIATPAAWVGTGVPLLVTYFLWKRKVVRIKGRL